MWVVCIEHQFRTEYVAMVKKLSCVGRGAWPTNVPGISEHISGFLVSSSFLCNGCGLFLSPFWPWETFSFLSPSLILSSFIQFYRYTFMACLDFVVCFSIQDFCWSMAAQGKFYVEHLLEMPMLSKVYIPVRRISVWHCISSSLCWGVHWNMAAERKLYLNHLGGFWISAKACTHVRWILML